jgi:hypothetical protein
MLLLKFAESAAAYLLKLRFGDGSLKPMTRPS